MPRYHYHYEEDGTLTPDPDGMPLSDDTVAHTVALRSIRDIISDEVRRTGLIDLARSLHVSRNGQSPARIVTFADAVDIRHGK